ncbi:hypothetical protein ACPR111641_16650 [Acinetobacter pragensis]
MTGWNKSIKIFFKVDHQATSKSYTYLTLIATVLIIISLMIGLLSNWG